MSGSRAIALVSALAAVLVVVLWYLLLWSPGSDELAAVETEIENVQAEQQTTRARVSALQSVRDQAPQLESELAATDALLPRDTALPSVLRQFQSAADDSGATLASVSPARPEPVEDDDELYSISFTAEVRGSYFQIVDVLRRLEDPAISPRGVLWDSISMNILELPELSATLSGRFFAVLPQPPAPDAEADPDAPPEPGAEDPDDVPPAAPPEDGQPDDAPPDDPTPEDAPPDDGADAEGTL